MLQPEPSRAETMETDSSLRYLTGTVLHGAAEAKCMSTTLRDCVDGKEGKDCLHRISLSCACRCRTLLLPVSSLHPLPEDVACLAYILSINRNATERDYSVTMDNVCAYPARSR